MINDPFTALNAILQSNTNITSLLGKYLLTDGTPGTVPLIKGGVLAEKETDLPALTFYSNGQEKNFNQRLTTFTINCYAETTRESFLIAQTLVNEYQSWFGVIDGYNMQTRAFILASIPDPQANEINTAVEIQLTNIGGA